MTQVETEPTLTPAQRDWVDALKSGDYPQAKGGLCRAITPSEDGPVTYGYCCLGVLTDRAIKLGKVQGGWNDLLLRGVNDEVAAKEYVHLNGYPEGGILPHEIQVYAELSANPSVPCDLIVEMYPEKLRTINFNGSEFAQASWLNDTLGLTLEEIGALFEEGFKRGVVR